MADPPASDRTLRQRLVPEIGDEGQERIDLATALVMATGLAGIVEARYLAGANFGLVRTSTHAATRAARDTNPTVALATDSDPVEYPDQSLASTLAEVIIDPSALAVASGAARALRQIRVAARIDVVPIFLKEKPPS